MFSQLQQRVFIGERMTNLTRLLSTEQSESGAQRKRRYSRHADKILSFMALHRVAMADQVQRRFKGIFHSDRMARLHLQTLVEAGDLGIDRVRAVGQPKIYRITTQCLKRLANGDSRAPRPNLVRSSTVLGNHLLHELMITEVGVQVCTAVQARLDLQLHWMDRFGLIGRPEFVGLIPDFAFLFQHGTGMLVCLIEVSCGEESPRRLEEKLQHYAAWAGTDLGQSFLTKTYRLFGAAAPRPQFRLVFVVQNRRTGNDMARLKQTILAGVKSSPDSLRRLWIANALTGRA